MSLDVKELNWKHALPYRLQFCFRTLSDIILNIVLIWWPLAPCVGRRGASRVDSQI
jgi:hypothetical protein